LKPKIVNVEIQRCAEDLKRVNSINIPFIWPPFTTKEAVRFPGLSISQWETMRQLAASSVIQNEELRIFNSNSYVRAV
jgi:hypothetical protein